MSRFALVLTSLALAMFAPASFAEAPTYRLSSVVFSKYLIGKGKLVFPFPILDTTLSANWKSGLSLSLEVLKNLKNGDLNTAGDEIDLGASYNRKVGDWTLRFELTYFDIQRLGRFGDGNIIQPVVGAFRPIKLNERHTITPFGRLEYVVFDGKSSANGLFTRLGVTDDWTLGRTTSLRHTLALLFNEGGGLGLRAGTDLLYFADFRVRVGKGGNANLVFPFRQSIPVNHNDSRETESVFGIGGEWKFK